MEQNILGSKDFNFEQQLVMDWYFKESKMKLLKLLTLIPIEQNMSQIQLATNISIHFMCLPLQIWFLNLLKSMYMAQELLGHSMLRNIFLNTFGFIDMDFIMRNFAQYLECPQLCSSLYKNCSDLSWQQKYLGSLFYKGAFVVCIPIILQ